MTGLRSAIIWSRETGALRRVRARTRSLNLSRALGRGRRNLPLKAKPRNSNPSATLTTPDFASATCGTRRCRHLGADLANGSVDREGCLVCPWHGARYDVATGRMTRGPQGFFAKVPGVDAGYRLMTRVLPLGRG